MATKSKTSISREAVEASENNKEQNEPVKNNVSIIYAMPEQLTFEDLGKLKEEQLINRFDDINNQSIILTAKIIYTLRQKIPSNQDWSKYIDSVLPQWKNTTSSTGRARILNLGEFLHRNGIESIEGQGISLTGLYAISSTKDDDIADKVYKKYLKKNSKVETIQKEIDKLLLDRNVVKVIEKPDTVPLTPLEQIVHDKEVLKEREKLLKLDARRKEKEEKKKAKLKANLEEIQNELSKLENVDNNQEPYLIVNANNTSTITVDLTEEEKQTLDELVAYKDINFPAMAQEVHNLLEGFGLMVADKITLLEMVLGDYEGIDH